MMNFLYYRNWVYSSPGVPTRRITDRDVISDLVNTGLKKILIASPEDYPTFQSPAWHTTDNFKKVSNYLIDNSIDVDFITAFDVEIVPEEYNTVFKVHQWLPYFINYTLMRLATVNDTYPHSNPTKKFICLNSRATLHRKIVLDYLSKYDLIDNNIVTWANLSSVEEYQFKYWNQKILKLEEINPQFFIRFPTEFRQTLFSLVLETNYRDFFLTEKTVKPILLKHPFLVVGNKGFNQRLVDLGFEQYTEIFDYSFDLEDDLDTRCHLAVKMINDIPCSNYSDIAQKLQPKIEHNYWRAIDIAMTNYGMPEVIEDYVEQLPKTDELYLTSRLKDLDFIKRFIKKEHNV